MSMRVILDLLQMVFAKKINRSFEKGRRHLIHNNFSEFMNLTLQGKFGTAAESVKSCGLSPIGCMYFCTCDSSKLRWAYATLQNTINLSISINLFAYSRDFWNLIGYATRYLFPDRQ